QSGSTPRRTKSALKPAAESRFRSDRMVCLVSSVRLADIVARAPDTDASRSSRQTAVGGDRYCLEPPFRRPSQQQRTIVANEKTTRKKTRRTRSSHPGVVLVKRVNPDGEVVWRARFTDPDTGRLCFVLLDPEALPNKTERR